MSLADYLYIDHARLNSYYDQIGRLGPIDKFKKLVFKLSMLGPATEISQEERQREANSIEKIEQVMKHLRECRILGLTRLRGSSVYLKNFEEFRLETFTAMHLFLPPADPESFLPQKRLDISPEDVRPYRLRAFDVKFAEQERLLARREALVKQAKDKIAGFQGINIWVSLNADGDSSESDHAHLFLLLDSKRDDAPPGAGTAYSTLLRLNNELSDLKKTILHPALDQLDNPESKIQKQFLRDPIGALTILGAHVLSERSIVSLYLVRDVVGSKEPGGKNVIATIAYPIFIRTSGLVEVHVSSAGDREVV